MAGRAQLTFAPRLLAAPEAAAYLGVSPSMLRGLPIARRMLGSKRLYDRLELDAYASDLPTEGGAESEANSCDTLFGATP